MPRQPEGKLVAKIRQLITDQGGRPFKIHGSDEGFQEVGIPDLLVCFKGIFVGIEVKQPGEKLRTRQRLLLKQIFDAGGVAAVVETVGQANLLLRYLSSLGDDDAGTCYNRGHIRHDRCSFL